MLLSPAIGVVTLYGSESPTTLFVMTHTGSAERGYPSYRGKKTEPLGYNIEEKEDIFIRSILFTSVSEYTSSSNFVLARRAVCQNKAFQTPSDDPFQCALRAWFVGSITPTPEAEYNVPT